MLRYIATTVLALLIWLAPTLLFLGFYYTKQTVPERTIVMHIALVTSTIIAFLSLLKLGETVLPKKVNKIFRILLTSLWFIINISLYLTIIMGLLSWNRIPTFDILLIYIAQLNETVSAVGVSYWVITLAVLIFILLLSLIVWLTSSLMRKLGEMDSNYNIKKKFIFCALLFLLSSFMTFDTWMYRILIAGDNKNPIYQLINPSIEGITNTVLLDVLGKRGDEKMEAYEDKVRQNYNAKASNNARSIILLTVDAMRPDHMGIYGTQRQTTPNLQKMKDAGMLHIIREARASCPESTCGLLSFLSGKEPQQLLMHNFNLTEILGKLGYKRYFFLGGDHSHYYGLRESYGTPDAYWDGTSSGKGYVNDDVALVDAIKALPPAQKDGNYFFFIHLMSVHGLGKKHPEFSHWNPSASIYNVTSSSSSSFSVFHNYYDNGVLQADFFVNEIYNSLKDKGYIDDSSIMLVSADHGESLGEHGIRTHATSLHEAEIRIPWVWIGRNFGSESDPVVQADFAPTILTAIGAPVPEHWRGLPLQHGTKERRFTIHTQTPAAAIIRYSEKERSKLIVNYKEHSETFFNLLSDPHELAPQKIKDAELEQNLEEAGFSYLGEL